MVDSVGNSVDSVEYSVEYMVLSVNISVDDGGSIVWPFASPRTAVKARFLVIFECMLSREYTRMSNVREIKINSGSKKLYWMAQGDFWLATSMNLF